ncbi:KAP family P-loop NTPase fold protein [Yersinia enterocolitica]|uniref:KAP family P-loop NTPase fold protein n=1 Tax=Yersinia enterocolitica TaxID=630 RepID=UPI003D78B3C7
MINLDNKITFSNRDEYKRKSIAEKIIKLITSDIDTSPMIIDGGWGTGKTEFCYKLINLLNESNPEYKTVYVDAFNEDHTDSPILTVLAAIVTLLPEAERPALIKKALPALRFGLKTALKASAGWVLRQNTDNLAEEFQEAIKETSSAAIDGTVETLLEDHIDSEKNIKTLKIALKEISDKNPIVIFIDELDRCKPSFAISILENIKHVFDVDNVHFILVTNTQQLQASINHIYGQSVDARRYLDKFIKFSFALSDQYKVDSHTRIYISSKHWEYTTQNSVTLSKLRPEFTDFALELIEYRSLSLREVETFIRYIELYQTLSDTPINNNESLGSFIYKIIGIFFYCFNKEIVLNITRNKINTDAVVSVLSINGIIYDKENHIPPSGLDLACYAILKESDFSTTKFAKPTAEQKENWNYLLDNCFKGMRGRNPSILKVMANTIDVMQLH